MSDTQTPPPATDQTPPPTGDLLGDRAPAPPTGDLLGDLPKPEGETKPGSEQQPPSDPAKPEGDKPPAKPEPPEKYELKIKSADGKTDQDADAVTVEAFTPLAKELGLTNEQAQKLTDFHQSSVQAIQENTIKTQTAAWAALQETWKGEARKDAEFGHLAGGRSFEENLGMARKGLDAFGTPALHQALRDSGMVNHPEVVRVFHRIGLAVAEDKIRVGGGTASSGQPVTLETTARALYPTMKQ